MAKSKKKETVNEEIHPKKGLDVKLKLDISDSGRLTATVQILQDGVVVAEDYDFVQVK